MVAETPTLVFVNYPFNFVGFHQTNRAERKPNAALQFAALKKIELEAAATEVEDDAGLNAFAERPVNGIANQLRFLFPCDDVDFNAGFAADAFEQFAAVARFASGGRGNGAIRRNIVVVHIIAKAAEGANGAANRFCVKQSARECIVTQADGGALVFDDFDVLRRCSAGDD